jgi:PAS domain S-box-containing protein
LKKLYVIDGPIKGKSFTLTDGITTIGRSSDNDICISDTRVSRHHAELVKRDDKSFIVDAGSLQGVFIDGEKIEPGLEVEITKESRVTIGKTILSFQKESPGEEMAEPYPTNGERKPSDTSESRVYTTRNYIRSLELLLRVSNILAQSLNIDKLLGELIDQIFNLLKRIDRGAILLVNRETGALEEAVSKTRMDDKEGIFSRIHYSTTIVQRTIKDGKPVMMSDTSHVKKTDLSDSIQQMNVRSVMCVPLTYKGDIRGVIYVDSVGLPDGFRKDDLQVLTGLSNTAAIAIENARLYEALNQELAERRRAEAALQKARKELEEQVEKRTAELSKTIEFLKEEVTEHMRAEEALRESEEKYRALFQESRDAIYITTREGKFVDINQSFLDLFGYTREEMADLRAQEAYVNPDDRSRFQQEIGQKGSVRDFEVNLRKKDGTEMNCLLTATVRRAADGRILGYQGIIRKITGRQQAAEGTKTV